MSRIGKKVIAIPAKTTVQFADGIFTATGPLGTLSKLFKADIDVVITPESITLVPKQADNTALWGTYASHVMNMIAGVNVAYTKKLVIEGIGYKSDVKGTTLVLSLGFSHPVNVPIPEGLKVTSDKNVLTITGSNKELVGQFTAQIRALKKPEPYKGKGIRYENEVVKRKQGKKSA